MKDNFSLRIKIAYIFIFVFGAVIATRLFFVQVVHSNDYKELASRQYVAPSAGYFDRGAIFFKKKDGQLISAATIKKGFILAINPKILNDAELAFTKISAVTQIDKDMFFKSAAKKSDTYEEVGRRLSNEEADKIKLLKLKGVDIYSEGWRFYPAGSLASRVLGFVGFNGDKLEGRYGLEKYYENILGRKEDNGGSANSFAEIIMDIKKTVSDNTPNGDIVLTIEPEAQSFFEESLRGVLDKYNAEMAGGIIIEPKTGKILAMASVPNFDPNAYGGTKDLSLFMNPSTQNVYEMGSIMKPLTLAAALDQNKITPETTYSDKGFVVFNNKRIENFDGKARGTVSMQEVLNQSLNTGAVFAMQQLGKEKFLEYIKNYGFGEKTGIDLPDEVQGLISNLNSMRDIEFATASFGQGIAVTPIEMALALSALANGGALMKPYVVERIKSQEGLDKNIEPVQKRQVLKKETSETISRMLVNVTDKALMGGVYKMDHYTIAAKTGTAQSIKSGGDKGYNEEEYIHTFFGYAPGFDARFLTLLYLVKPQGVKYASHSLSEPFMNITKFLLNYYQVPPDR
ncbi:MAG: penicillin-binding protein 2 [Candidatus Paceibacterota bacterium]